LWLFKNLCYFVQEGFALKGKKEKKEKKEKKTERKMKV